MGSPGWQSPPPSPPSGDQSEFEPNIGKLKEGHTNLSHLSRDQVYHILRKEPDDNPVPYPRTRSHHSRSFRQFQPSWTKKYPWLHYSSYVDGAFCRACVFFCPG